jgi:hypothetical protein
VKVFVSYARLNKDTAESLVRDLHALGHQAFYDRDLTGGQRWWDTLLDQIVNSDVFVPVLSDEYRESEACRSEADWAEALDVPFLPVTVVPQLPGMYAPMIAESNWVSYDSTDRNALADLSRAVAATQPTARPEPLPERPHIPLSYLVLVEREIRIEEDLGRHRQLAIVSNLRSKLGGREASGARELLAALRERPDVTHEVATTIDSLLAGHGDDVAPTPHRGDEPAATQAEEGTSQEPDAVLTPVAEEENRVADVGSAADAPAAAVDQDLPEPEDEPPPAPLIGTTRRDRRDRPPPLTEVDPVSYPVSQGRQGSRLARALVVLGGGLVYLSVSVVPWVALSEEAQHVQSPHQRVWLPAIFMLSDSHQGFALPRWFGAALACVLVAAVVGVTAWTQVRPVPSLVRVIACIVSGLAAVLGFVAVKHLDHFVNDNAFDVAAGPFVLTLGLAMLALVLVKPNIGAQPDTAGQLGRGSDSAADPEGQVTQNAAGNADDHAD